MRFGLIGLSAFVVLILFSLAAETEKFPVSVVFLLVSLIFSVYVLGFTIISRSFAPVIYCFCLYTIFGLLVPAIHHTLVGRFPFYGIAYPQETVLQGAIVVAISTFCTIAGYWATVVLRAGSETGKVPTSFSASAPTSSIHFAFIALVALGFSLFSVFAVGGETFSTSRGAALSIQQASPSEAIGQAVARASSFVCLVYALAILKHRTNLSCVLLLAVALSVFAYTNNPESTARFFIVAYLFSLWFIFGSVTSLSRSLVAVMTAPVAFIALPILANLSRGDVVGAIDLPWMQYWFEHGDFDGFQSVLNVMEMTSEQGYGMGIYLLSALLVFVPRAVWPEKSQGLGVDAAHFMGYPFTNISSPLSAEFFVDFGFFGVIVLSLLYGSFMAHMDKQYSRYRRTGSVAGMLAPVLFAGFQFILLRGSLVGVLAPVGLTLLISGLAQIAVVRMSSPSAYLPARGI